MAYSEKVIDHYENPRNVGKMDAEDPDVGTGMVGAPACGDVMRLQIKVNDAGVIEDATEHSSRNFLQVKDDIRFHGITLGCSVRFAPLSRVRERLPCCKTFVSSSSIPVTPAISAGWRGP